MSAIRSFIPDKVSNHTVVEFFEMMRGVQRIVKRRYRKNDAPNFAADMAHRPAVKKAGGYIEDQHSWKDMRYGLSTVSFSGCEVIAVYNALNDLAGTDKISMFEMVRGFERDGMVFFGIAGTSMKALERYFSSRGYHTEYSESPAEFDDIAGRSDTMILTMYNDRNDIAAQIHTICISKKRGLLYAHNVYCNGAVVGPADDLTGMLKIINGGKAKGISLIGIRR